MFCVLGVVLQTILDVYIYIYITLYFLSFKTFYVLFQTLDILVIVLQQSHKESEERWKRLSRQITDVILPTLAKQQVWTE